MIAVIEHDGNDKNGGGDVDVPITKVTTMLIKNEDAIGCRQRKRVVSKYFEAKKKKKNPVLEI